MSSSNLASVIAKKLNRHAPTILTVVSTIGVGATAFLFARAGMKAERAIQYEVRTNEEFEDRYPTYTEQAEYTWYYYVIPTSIAIATVTAVVCANALNQNRQAALIGAYALAERTVSKYRGQISDLVGYDAATEVREDIIRDVAKETVINPDVFAKDGTVYLDVFSGQQFISDEPTIRKAMDHTNEKCEEDGFVSLNYFYDRIGARTTQLGEILGWSDGFPLDIILTEIKFEDGSEGFGLDYARMPFMGYHEI